MCVTRLRAGREDDGVLAVEPREVVDDSAMPLFVALVEAPEEEQLASDEASEETVGEAAPFVVAALLTVVVSAGGADAEAEAFALLLLVALLLVGML